MSDDALYLDAAEAAAGSRALRAAGELLGAQRNGLGGDLEDVSAAVPWGSDEYGRSFEKQYRPVEQQVMDAWQHLAAYLEGLGEAAAHSVEDNVGADVDAERRFLRGQP
ncbi:MAG: hypothetical protein ABW022_22410 [Actinoplanes sp.]